MMAGRGAVVVTGASSGIGRATALRLAHDGWLVLVGVRHAADGAALAALAAAIGTGELLRPLSLDVTDDASVAAAARDVAALLAERRLTLGGLVNNAGIAVAGPVEEVPLARLREVLAVNVVGAVAATQAFLPLLRRGRGRIINLSSVSGRVAAPFLGPYAASKFALEALSDALRVEVAAWGVRVILIEPGPVATPIWAKGAAMAEADRAGIGEDSPYVSAIGRVQAAFRDGERRGIPPEAVADVIARALSVSRPRARYLISRNGAAVELLARAVPTGLRDWLMRRGGEDGDERNRAVPAPWALHGDSQDVGLPDQWRRGAAAEGGTDETALGKSLQRPRRARRGGRDNRGGGAARGLGGGGDRG